MNRFRADMMRYYIDTNIYDPSKYRDYDRNQKLQIQRGLESGVDVGIYANPVYTGQQMWQIRLGLESGLDVSVYADPSYDYEQMEEIREDLEF